MEQLYFLCDSNYIENFVAILDVIINVKTTLFQCRTANAKEILCNHVRCLSEYSHSRTPDRDFRCFTYVRDISISHTHTRPRERYKTNSRTLATRRSVTSLFC